MDLDQPVATTEFLVVDTETNGLAGDACELTEVGAVLVGGGELHERWETLLTVRAPLSRGIQRFTGITQAMVDEAPPAEAQLPELAAQLRGRVLVAHSASFDRRVLRQAFERAGLRWPNPPQLCTVALARRLHPLGRQRRLRALAESLGIDVEVSHRALADAETCARVFCALFPRLCAHATDRARGARPRAARAPAAPAGQGHRRPGADAAARAGGCPTSATSPTTPASTWCATPRARSSTSASRSACARGRGRTSSPVVARGRVGRAGRDGRARAHELRARRAAAREPAHQAPAPAGQRAPQARRPLRLPALPPGHRLPGPRGGARAGGGPRRQRRPAARARGRRGAARAAQLALRPAPLRAQAAAPLLAQRVRADGPLPVAVPGRPRPQPLPPSPRRGAGAVHRRGRRRRRAAGPPRRADARPPRPSRTSSARRGCAGGASAWPGCSSAWAASSPPRTPGRGSCSPSTRAAGAATRSGSWAAASSTGGRRATSTRSWSARSARCAAATGPARRRAWRPTRSTRRGSSPPGSTGTMRSSSTSTAAPTGRRSRGCSPQRTTTVMPMPGECSVQTMR